MISKERAEVLKSQVDCGLTRNVLRFLIDELTDKPEPVAEPVPAPTERKETP